jgi:hypothetical protein
MKSLLQKAMKEKDYTIVGNVKELIFRFGSGNGSGTFCNSIRSKTRGKIGSVPYKKIVSDPQH